MVHQIKSSGQLSALELLQSAQAMRAQRLAQQDSGAANSGQGFEQALSQNLQGRGSTSPANNPIAASAVTNAATPVVTPQANSQASVSNNQQPNAQSITDTTTMRGVTASAFQQLQPMIAGVSEVAQNAGFVGIQPQEIVKAYYSGQSFLADYRV